MLRSGALEKIREEMGAFVCDVARDIKSLVCGNRDRNFFNDLFIHFYKRSLEAFAVLQARRVVIMKWKSQTSLNG